MAVDAVLREPVSAGISLLTGKIQGIFAYFSRLRSYRTGFQLLIQWIKDNFPKNLNRESFLDNRECFLDNRECFDRNREFYSWMRETGTRRYPALDEYAKASLADKVFRNDRWDHLSQVRKAISLTFECMELG